MWFKKNRILCFLSQFHALNVRLFSVGNTACARDLLKREYKMCAGNVKCLSALYFPCYFGLLYKRYRDTNPKGSSRRNTSWRFWTSSRMRKMSQLFTPTICTNSSLSIETDCSDQRQTYMPSILGYETKSVSKFQIKGSLLIPSHQSEDRVHLLWYFGLIPTVILGQSKLHELLFLAYSLFCIPQQNGPHCISCPMSAVLLGITQSLLQCLALLPESGARIGSCWQTSCACCLQHLSEVQTQWREVRRQAQPLPMKFCRMLWV